MTNMHLNGRWLRLIAAVISGKPSAMPVIVVMAVSRPIDGLSEALVARSGAKHSISPHPVLYTVNLFHILLFDSIQWQNVFDIGFETNIVLNVQIL